MTTDENILVEMLERVTNPSRESSDNLAVQMFCMIVQSNIDLVTKAHTLIVEKMHSNNTTEATRAIGLLEECMSKAGSEFQKKTAKFTFLNELIALVLDKHEGQPAPIETKKRIMDCLMLWTVEHNDKTKIQEAYDNLKRQVNFDHSSSSTANSTSSVLSNPRMERSSILGKDEQVVAKLLKQGGTENYKKANLLIQHRVNQDTRRTEFICHLKSELKKIESTMEVFEQMLEAYTLDSADGDNRDIIHELYNTCKKQNEQMARWPDFLGEGEPTFLEDVLNTRDLLMVSLQRYKEIFESEQSSIHVNSHISKTNIDLLSDLLGEPATASIQDTNTNKQEDSIKKNSTLNELNEVFGSVANNPEVDKAHHPFNLMNNLDLLEPISVFETKSKDKSETTLSITPTKLAKAEKKVSVFKELKEIDILSDEIFNQNLKEEQRLQSFKKNNEKLTLNDMAKHKIQTPINVNKDIVNLVQKDLKSNHRKKLDTFDDLPINFEDSRGTRLDLDETTQVQEKNEEPEQTCLKENNNSENCKTLPFKPLADIFVDLDGVTPLDEGQRLLLDDDDIQVTLYFTANRPSEHVSVIVISVINKSKLPVRDFHFEASVKKPCKVRLLPPTDVVMAPRNPFKPLTPINQIVLLLNPTKNPVDISCIIGYKLGDDPDPIKELIVTKDIPYV